MCTVLNFAVQGLLDDAVAVLKKWTTQLNLLLGMETALFRALAYILYGDETIHEKMRKLLANFISQNWDHMQLYIEGDIREYA